MSFYALKNIVVKVRKPHQCWGCGITVVPGFQMNYSAGVSDGDFHASYWCEICKAYMDQYPFYFEDGLHFGELASAHDFKEFKRELLSPKRLVIVEKYIAPKK